MPVSVSRTRVVGVCGKVKTCAGHMLSVGWPCTLCTVVAQVESPVYSRQVEIPLYFILCLYIYNT